MTRLAFLAGLFATLLTATALAHTGDRIFSTWTVDEAGVTATVRLPFRLAARYGGGHDRWHPDALAGHFLRTLHISTNTTDCMPARAPLIRAAAAIVVIELSWRCAVSGAAGDAEELILRVDPLFSRLPNHVHLARLHLPDGRMDEAIFTYGNRLHRVTLNEKAPSEHDSWTATTAEYVGLGLTHILTGADHLAFMLALILAVPALRSLLLVITGFTLGHSLTLALAATGMASPVPAAVEALIGFTVAIAAVEAAGKISGRALAATSAIVPLTALALAAAFLGSALPIISWAGLLLFTAAYMTLARRAEGSRWAAALATAFGLIHGLGFAGVLQEIGPPEGRLIPALLGFNLGVEAGQVMAVILALIFAVAARRLMPAQTRCWAAQGMSAVLCGLGTFWFVSRAFAE